MSVLVTAMRISWPWAAGLGAMVFGLFACQPHEPSRPSAITPALGADRDEKSCIGSAGYVWSPLQARCLRVFEEGLAFAPTPANPDGTLQAFVLINKATNTSKAEAVAELFWPGQAQPVALRRPSGQGDTLLQDSRAQVQLVRAVSDYQILVKGQALFARPMHTSESLTGLR